MTEIESFLVGAWHRGQGKASVLTDPSTGEAVAEVRSTAVDPAEILAYARQAGGAALRALTFAERGALLKAMSQALHAEREALIEVSIASAGTTRSDAKFDIDGAIGTLAFYAGLGESLGARTFLADGEGAQLARSPRFFGYHVRVPLPGAAVHINAFNFPAWGMAEKAAVALLAGVPVITKPATSTALLAGRIARVWVEKCALPPGAFQFVVGDIGPVLARLGAGDAVAFTGSGSTGAVLRGLEAVVSRATRISVEADSLNAAVLAPEVEEGSDVFRAFVREVAREMTQKTGQKCTAIRRIFVPRARVEAAIAGLIEELAALKVGDPRDESVRMGPLATHRQRDDFRDGIAALVKDGARVVWGDPARVTLVTGDAEKGAYVGPVLLTHDAPRQATAVHEREVFGPAATVMAYDGLDEAAALVIRGGGSLVAALYAESVDTVQALVGAIAPHHGRVWISTGKVVDQTTPSGMVLPSCVHGGPGRAGGGEELGGPRGLDFYTQRVAVQGDRAVLERALGLGASA